MKRSEYFKRAADLYGSGKVSGEVYDAMIMNVDSFCDDEEDEDGYQGGLPDTYAEVEYSDFDNAMIMNADIFCDEEEDAYQGGLPPWYAEVEYSDFDSAEAVDGARFDDMNYLRYTER